jgi:tetratricopeptide (TPR) repeat protein
MFGPEWPRLSPFKKLLLRANVILEESPNDSRSQLRALTLYRQALELQDSRLVWRNVGRLHFNRKEWENAEIAFKNSRDHFWLGLLYEWTNRLEEGWEHIRKATPSADQARVMARIARQTGRCDEGIAALRPWNDVDSLFEMIHLYDLKGDDRRAWQTSVRANAAKGLRDPDPFRPGRIPVPHEPAPGAPVFVIGMPRSGTTLLERMIAQHPAMETKGESLFFDFIAGQLAGGQKLTRIGEAYLVGHTMRTVDKYPLNFQYLDLIRGVFPDARILDMRRSRDDTLLSCWFRNFRGQMRWAYNWDDLQTAYDRYLEAMEYRTDVMKVRYEQLVLNPEAVLRKVLEYCGLPWDECCLNHNADDSFHDYSYQEVRRPIFREHIGRSDRYQAFFPGEQGLEALA